MVGLCAEPKMDAVGVESKQNAFLFFSRRRMFSQRNQLCKVNFHSFDEKDEIGKFDFRVSFLLLVVTL